ncbi:PfkB family carbohydrate kinase [Tessaracoccus sp. G1721]
MFPSADGGAERRQAMGPVVRTVTFNTGFDDHFLVDGVTWGGVEKARAYESQPSGKGVFVARRVALCGVPAHAYYLIGEREQAQHVSEVEAAGVTVHSVPVPGRTRHNLTLLMEGHVAAHMVSPGYQLVSARPAEELLAAVVADTQPGDVVTLNGSIPAVVPPSSLASTVVSLAARGARVISDNQGPQLVAAVATGLLAAVKPNDEEVRALDVLGEAHDLVGYLTLLARFGVGLPIITLGAKGVAFLDGGKAWRGGCRVERPKLSVGAGDAFVTGLAIGVLEGRAPRDTVAWASACAAAHVTGVDDAGFRVAAEEAVSRFEAVPA